MTKYKLTKSKEKNREILKQFLRDHAKNFNMSHWIGSLEVEELLIDSRKPDPKLAKKAIALFEECGSSCCIGGALRILTGLRWETWDMVKLFGIKPNNSSLASDAMDSDLFYAGNWPIALRLRYRTARDVNNYEGMVAAACDAIDHFTEE